MPKAQYKVSSVRHFAVNHEYSVLSEGRWTHSSVEILNWAVIIGMRPVIANRRQLPFVVMNELIDTTMSNSPRLQSRCLVIFYLWSHSGSEPTENIQLANLDRAGCQICCTKVCVSQGNTSNLSSHLWA